MERIIYLKTSELYSHPDNPRKDLGDLTELADSIKAKGVMQNLTVVPRKEGGYTVIIGHRRCGAAKLAGVTELPCVISDMNEKEQLETMMLENMQRSDLTLYEQAKGFQMMFDFGESIEEIAEKTGISKTTIRNRMKLARYDEELMKAAELRQPTFDQYLKLAEIEDEHVANECLRLIGTKNFDNEVSKAIRVQREKREREIIRAVFEKKAERLRDASYEAVRNAKLITVETLYSTEKKDIEKKLNEYSEKYGKLYWSESYGFTIYRDTLKSDEDRLAESQLKAKARSDLEKKAGDIYDAIVERAEDFVLSYKDRKGDFEPIHKFLFEQTIEGKRDYQGSSTYNIAEALGYTVPEGRHSWEEEIREEANNVILKKYQEAPCSVLLLYLLEVNRRKKPCFLSYREDHLTYNSNNFSEFLYLLSSLGYNVSDEEWEFLYGGHPIYKEVVLI